MLKSIALFLALAAGCASAPAAAPAQPQPPPAQAQEPPPAPPPPPDVQERPAVRVKDIVQPVKIEKQDPQADDGVEGGEEGGVEGGVVGGVVGDPNGSTGAVPPPPPPPPSARPQVVAPALLEANRSAGSKLIAPDAKTRTAIARSGKTHVVSTVKLCVDDTGAVAGVTKLKSSGFPDYDALISSTIRGTWQYRPFVVNGVAVPVCTAVTFIYSQN